MPATPALSPPTTCRREKRSQSLRIGLPRYEIFGFMRVCQVVGNRSGAWRIPSDLQVPASPFSFQRLAG